MPDPIGESGSVPTIHGEKLAFSRELIVTLQLTLDYSYECYLMSS